MSEIRAEAKNLRISAKKVRPVVAKVRGRMADTVVEELKFVDKKAALHLSKVLKSAIANAKQNLDIDSTKLKIKEIRIDEGPTLKRFRPVSRGSAHSILKRTSHIKIVLEDS